MFVNSHPTLDVSHKVVKGEHAAGAPVILRVSLARDVDEDNEEGGDQNVIVPFYPSKKMANWWIVVGDPTSR